MFDPNDQRQGLFNWKKKSDEKIDLSKVPASQRDDLNLGLGIGSTLNEPNATLKPVPAPEQTKAKELPGLPAGLFSFGSKQSQQPPQAKAKELPGLPAGLFSFGSKQSQQPPQAPQPPQQISMSRIPAQGMDLGLGLGLGIGGGDQTITPGQAANIRQYLNPPAPQPGAVMVNRFGNQPSWFELITPQSNGIGTPAQTTEGKKAIAESNAAQQPVAATPITSQVVSDTDRVNSDLLVRGVMGNSANQNLKNINNSADVRNTMNEAWKMRGAGIQVGIDPKTGGVMFSNSTGPEKMRYTGADGKATNNWSDTAEFKQGIDTAGRIKALADGMERQRYLDAGDGERLGAIDRMRQTDATIANANATQGIAKQELGMKKETHDAQMKQTKILQDAQTAFQNNPTQENYTRLQAVLNKHDPRYIHMKGEETVDPQSMQKVSSGDEVFDTWTKTNVQHNGGATTNVKTISVGDVVNGYRFKGGDTKDRNNWEKV